MDMETMIDINNINDYLNGKYDSITKIIWMVCSPFLVYYFDLYWIYLSYYIELID